MTDAEALLRTQLGQLAAGRDQRLVGLNAAIAQAQGAIATAGTEYDDQVVAAEENATQAASDYDQFLGETSSRLTDAQTAVDQIDSTPPTVADIDDIEIAGGPIDDITITPGGTPDCAAADIQTAVNAGLADLRAALAGDIEAAVNAALEQIRTAIGVIVDNMSNGNVEQTKAALQALKDTGQGMRDQLPPSTDNEAQKAADYATLDGMF